jgi:hypothetical protein
MQNIRRLRFIAPQFTPESGVNQLNAGELHWLSHKKYEKGLVRETACRRAL